VPPNQGTDRHTDHCSDSCALEGSDLAAVSSPDRTPFPASIDYPYGKANRQSHIRPDYVSYRGHTGANSVSECIPQLCANFDSD